MIIFPAIDILDNQCVRLTQGDFSQVKVYSNKPVEMAKKWETFGCEFLHLVNLNGAKNESAINDEVIKEIVETLNIPVQLGGGIRNIETVEKYINMGVARVILGTAAIEDEEFLIDLVSKYKEKIAVSVDSKNGFVATRGWKEITEKKSIEFCKELEALGVKTVIFTDILKDGLLSGPNMPIYEELKLETNLDIVASGGVSTMEDIETLNRMDMYGAILGKALYEEKLLIGEVLRCLQKE